MESTPPYRKGRLCKILANKMQGLPENINYSHILSYAGCFVHS